MNNRSAVQPAGKPRPVGKAPWIDENAITTAGYIENRINLPDRLAFTPGVRYDQFKRNAETGSDTFDDVTWALSVDFAVTDSLILFASVRDLFKSPQLIETFVYYRNTTTLASNIKAQSGMRQEIGARFQQQFGQHRVSANLTLFQTDLHAFFANTCDAVQDGYIIGNNGDMETSWNSQWVPPQAKRLPLTLAADNLFDKQHCSHASHTGVARGFALYDEPGRTIKVSAAYQF